MDVSDLLHRFQSHLVAAGKSPHTVEPYTRDLRLFAGWFEGTNGKSLTPRGSPPSTYASTALIC